MGWCLQTVSVLAFFTALLCSLVDADRMMIVALYFFAFTAFFGPEVKQLPDWTGRLLVYVRSRPHSRYYLPLISLILEPGGFGGLGTLYGWIFTGALPLIALVAAFFYLSVCRRS